MDTIAEVLQAMQAIVDGAEGRSLTDDEITQYETHEGTLQSLRRDQEVRGRQNAYNTPSGAPAVVTSGSLSDGDSLERAFDHYLRSGQENADIQELRAQGTTPGSAGGFTVPETFRQKMVERMVAFGGLSQTVETITTASGEAMRWPTLDDTSNEGEIVDENAAPAGGSDLAFGEVTLGAFKYMAPGAGSNPLRVSLELLQDSAFDVQGLVARKLGTRIARTQASDWATGAGTTEPVGIAGNASASAEMTVAGPTYAELLSVVHALDPEYRTSARWVFNDAYLELIEGVTDGNGRPLLNNATDGIQVGRDNQRLLGYPITIDQSFPNVAASTAFGVFGDMAESYVIRRVQDVTLIVNPYSRANQGQVEYVVWARADGVPQNTWSYVNLTGAAA